MPTYPWINGDAPAPVTGLKKSGDIISWDKAPAEGKATDVNHYVIYASDSNDAAAVIADPENILTVTYENSFDLEGTLPTYIFVTALDRVNNESEPIVLKVK